MRSIITLCIVCLLAISIQAQNRNCRGPMADNMFTQKHRAIINQKNENLKLELANNLVSNNCLSADQVKRIAVLFKAEYNRLNFAKNAYESTFDKENFYFVYDAFNNMSSAFMLHDYVNNNDGYNNDYNNSNNNYPGNNQGNNNNDYQQPYEPAGNTNFANYDYPHHYNYRGASNCDMPISDGEFSRLVRQTTGNDQNRLNSFTQIVRNNCMSVAQVMKLASLIPNENNRLVFMKNAWPSIYDLGNLSFGVQLFMQVQNKTEYNRFIHQNQGNPQGCRVSDVQFSEMIRSIKKESFDANKLILAKNIIKTNPCFTSAQIKNMAKEFSFDNGKFELATFAWDYTVDRENFYRVGDVFTFSTTRQDLMKFIEDKR